MITFTDNCELVQALAITLRNLERDHALAYEKSLVAATLQQVTTSLTRKHITRHNVLIPPLGTNDQIMISGDLETILNRQEA